MKDGLVIFRDLGPSYVTRRAGPLRAARGSRSNGRHNGLDRELMWPSWRMTVSSRGAPRLTLCMLANRWPADARRPSTAIHERARAVSRADGHVPVALGAVGAYGVVKATY